MLIFNRHRYLLKLFIDSGLWIIAAPLAYALRLDQAILNHHESIIAYTVFMLPFKIMAIYSLGLYRQSWMNVSIPDLKNLVLGVGVVFFAASIPLFFIEAIFVPVSIPFLEAMIALSLMGLVRVGARFYSETTRFNRASSQNRVSRVLIVGAGEMGILVAKEMLRQPEKGLNPVAFVDDDSSKQMKSYFGISVLGTCAEIPDIAKEKKIDKVLIAIPSAGGSVVRRVVDISKKINLKYQILPSFHDVLTGDISISNIRDVDVKDLLRRDQVTLCQDEISKYLTGKTILVTGSGGSIGSEIVRQVLKFKPQRIILVGRGENSIYELMQELKVYNGETELIPVITDVRDYASLDNLFSGYRPNVVYHAAAHKHVPLMEANPGQAILNNIFGTQNLVNLSVRYGVERFVNISTDKAVNPTSIMGASKRAAEMVVQKGSMESDDSQVFVSVRFGNVLGSRGSVIPLFKKQIENGGPVTVTHPDMVRYFMTIPEASQLVLQAGGMDSNGTVYVLDMGEPVKISDLAEDLITLSGLVPHKDIEIKYAGIRPGEKLYEELLTAEEGTTSSKFEKIFIAKQNGVLSDDFEKTLEELRNAADHGDEHAIRYYLKTLVPTFSAGEKSPENGEGNKSDGQLRNRSELIKN